LLETTAGRTVPEETLHALTPLGTAGVLGMSALALLGAMHLAGSRRGVAVALVVAVVAPVAFFTLVPAGGTRFFARYILPTLPFFLLLVVSGCRFLGQRARRPVLVGGLLVALLAVAEVAEGEARLEGLHGFQLTRLVAAARGDGRVLFSSTGTPASDRPPELLDRFLELETPGIELVEELPAIDPRYEPGVRARGAETVRRFLRGGRASVGIWVLSGKPSRVARAYRRLGRLPGVEARRISPRLLLVRTRRARRPPELVATGCRVRTAWLAPVRADALVRALLDIEHRALRHPACARG
jgi:hypothetical protein